MVGGRRRRLNYGDACACHILHFFFLFFCRPMESFCFVSSVFLRRVCLSIHALSSSETNKPDISSSTATHFTSQKGGEKSFSSFSVCFFIHYHTSHSSVNYSFSPLPLTQLLIHNNINNNKLSSKLHPILCSYTYTHVRTSLNLHRHLPYEPNHTCLWPQLFLLACQLPQSWSSRSNASTFSVCSVFVQCSVFGVLIYTLQEIRFVLRTCVFFHVNKATRDRKN